MAHVCLHAPLLSSYPVQLVWIPDDTRNHVAEPCDTQQKPLVKQNNAAFEHLRCRCHNTVWRKLRCGSKQLLLSESPQ